MYPTSRIFGELWWERLVSFTGLETSAGAVAVVRGLCVPT